MKIIETYRNNNSSAKLKTNGLFYFVKVKVRGFVDLYFDEKYDDLDLALDRYYTYKKWIDEREKENDRN